MKPFLFSGSIPASKSVLQRLCILKHYRPDLTIEGNSDCQDVSAMKSALHNGLRNGVFDCNASATAFRFLSVLASRLPQCSLITGSQQLLARPHRPIVDLLRGLGVRARIVKEGMQIGPGGWQKPKAPLQVDTEYSSQFISAVLLNAWGLNWELELATPGEGSRSVGYLNLTLKLVRDAGMRFSRPYCVEPQAQVRRASFNAELDCSSAFAIAALAAVNGRARIENWCESSGQPDAVFPEILKKMGAQVNVLGTSLEIEKANSLMAIAVDVRHNPDLFPVLSVLCAFAQGKSQISGISALAFKESNRIQGVSSLLDRMGVVHRLREDELDIWGGAEHRSFLFDPCDDHRLVFAAELANAAGFRIKILNRDCVKKSYPEFIALMRKQVT